MEDRSGWVRVERWVRSNTVHLAVWIWMEGMQRALHLMDLSRTFQLLILRLTPLGLERFRLEFAGSFASSCRIAAWALRRWAGGREPRNAAGYGG